MQRRRIGDEQHGCLSLFFLIVVCLGLDDVALIDGVVHLLAFRLCTAALSDKLIFSLWRCKSIGLSCFYVFRAGGNEITVLVLLAQ